MTNNNQAAIEQTPEQRIDAALDKVLRASGSGLKYYSLPGSLEKMRKAIREIMSDSYIAGSNSVLKTMGAEHDGK